MITLPIISLVLLLVYLLDALSGNASPPKNPIAKRILLSILIGFALQLAGGTMVPGVLIVLTFYPSDALKAGHTNDWRVLVANMLLYAGLSFLIMTELERNKRTKKTPS